MASFQLVTNRDPGERRQWVADAAPPELTGSLLALQTALGFALTTATVQLAPLVAERTGWAALLALLALGPALGILAMRPLVRRELSAGP